MKLYYFFIFFIFLSCKDEKSIGADFKVKKYVSNKNKKVLDSDRYAIKDSLRRIKRAKIELEERIDSLNIDKVLKEAISIAKMNLHRKNFYKQYQIEKDTSLPIKVEVKSGRFFSHDNKHLIINIRGKNCTNNYIYDVNDKQVKQILYHNQWNMEFIKDTLFDVNGDGFKDFSIIWYGVNGCCLKGFYYVYIYNYKENNFSKKIEFINPTFYPKEKVVRGIEYGHPGETKMYKFRWNNNFEVDTLESVYFNPNTKSDLKFVVEKNDKEISNKKLYFKKLPNEYKSVKDLDWFLGKI